ncbi:MAG TPA: translation elongation factor Ts [Spirochaetia bacterium]|nr:translation elongation factor Ts [Spirochaetales bacterium]HRY73001.1 translation elongation factor Ts [Spirochaetia bacterium]
MKIDVAALKELRARTEAGMLDCRKALEASLGDLEAAASLLAEWGLAGAARREEREAREGRVFAACGPEGAALLELSCETDFAARSAPFLAAGGKAAEAARDRRLSEPDGGLAALVAGLGPALREKVALRRLAWLGRGEGELVEAYLHGEGRIGVLVKCGARPAGALLDGEVRGLVRDLALQVAAFGPRFLEAASLPEGELEAMAADIRAEVEADPLLGAKPLAVRERAAAGRLAKRLAADSLLDRGFVRDEGRSVREAIAEVEARRGCELRVAGFARFEVGAE